MPGSGDFAVGRRPSSQSASYPVPRPCPPYPAPSFPESPAAAAPAYAPPPREPAVGRPRPSSLADGRDKRHPARPAASSSGAGSAPCRDTDLAEALRISAAAQERRRQVDYERQKGLSLPLSLPAGSSPLSDPAEADEALQQAIAASLAESERAIQQNEQRAREAEQSLSMALALSVRGHTTARAGAAAPPPPSAPAPAPAPVPEQDEEALAVALQESRRAAEEHARQERLRSEQLEQALQASRAAAMEEEQRRRQEQEQQAQIHAALQATRAEQEDRDRREMEEFAQHVAQAMDLSQRDHDLYLTERAHRHHAEDSFWADVCADASSSALDLTSSAPGSSSSPPPVRASIASENSQLDQDQGPERTLTSAQEDETDYMCTLRLLGHSHATRPDPVLMPNSVAAQLGLMGPSTTSEQGFPLPAMMTESEEQPPPYSAEPPEDMRPLQPPTSSASEHIPERPPMEAQEIAPSTSSISLPPPPIQLRPGPRPLPPLPVSSTSSASTSSAFILPPLPEASVVETPTPPQTPPNMTPPPRRPPPPPPQGLAPPPPAPRANLTNVQSAPAVVVSAVPHTQGPEGEATMTQRVGILEHNGQETEFAPGVSPPPSPLSSRRQTIAHPPPKAAHETGRPDGVQRSQTDTQPRTPRRPPPPPPPKSQTQRRRAPSPPVKRSPSPAPDNNPDLANPQVRTADSSRPLNPPVSTTSDAPRPTTQPKHTPTSNGTHHAAHLWRSLPGLEWGWAKAPFDQHLASCPPDRAGAELAFPGSNFASDEDGGQGFDWFPACIPLTADPRFASPQNPGAAHSNMTTPNDDGAFFVVRAESWESLLYALAWLGNSVIDLSPSSPRAITRKGAALRVDLEFLTPSRSGVNPDSTRARLAAPMFGLAPPHLTLPSSSPRPNPLAATERQKHRSTGTVRRATPVHPSVAVCLSLLPAAARAQTANPTALARHAASYFRQQQGDLDLQAWQAQHERKVITLPPRSTVYGGVLHPLLLAAARRDGGGAVSGASGGHHKPPKVLLPVPLRLSQLALALHGKRAESGTALPRPVQKGYRHWTDRTAPRDLDEAVRAHEKRLEQWREARRETTESSGKGTTNNIVHACRTATKCPHSHAHFSKGHSLSRPSRKSLTTGSDGDQGNTANSATDTESLSSIGDMDHSDSTSSHAPHRLSSFDPFNLISGPAQPSAGMTDRFWTARRQLHDRVRQAVARRRDVSAYDDQLTNWITPFREYLNPFPLLWCNTSY